jgi:predicted deacylase
MFKTRLRARAVSSLLAAVSLGLGSVALATESDQPEPGDTQLDEISVPLTRRATEPATAAASPHTLKLLGMEVPPGSSRRLSWSASEIFEGISETTPVLAVNGAEPGPVLCLTGAVHGDELNGIEIVRRVIHNLDPQKLQGAVIGVPIVNLQGFRRASRYLPDRRDLNRYFPGNPRGSSASRIAHSFFNEIIVHCDALVDLHTGSFHRTNLPQIRADVRHPGVVDLTHGFDSMVVLHSPPSEGTLRRAATAAGIPAVTMEVGEPMRLQPEEVERGEEGIESLLNSLGMIRKLRFWSEPEPVYYESTWIRSDHGGLLITAVELGQQIARNERLGTVTDPITNQSHDIIAPSDGRVLGMALNQVVMPGFAAIRLGLPTSEAQAIRSAQQIGLAQESKRANVDDILYAIRGEAEGNIAPVPDDAAD